MENKMDKEKVFPSFIRQNKWLGIMDYKTLIIFGIYIYSIYLIGNAFGASIKMIISIMIIFSAPLIAALFVNSKEENIIDILFVILKYCLSRKNYYYKIESIDELDMPFKNKRRKRFNIDKILETLKI